MHMKVILIKAFLICRNMSKIKKLKAKEKNCNINIKVFQKTKMLVTEL